MSLSSGAGERAALSTASSTVGYRANIRSTRVASRGRNTARLVATSRQADSVSISVLLRRNQGGDRGRAEEPDLGEVDHQRGWLAGEQDADGLVKFRSRCHVELTDAAQDRGSALEAGGDHRNAWCGRVVGHGNTPFLAVSRGPYGLATEPARTHRYAPV